VLLPKHLCALNMNKFIIVVCLALVLASCSKNSGSSGNSDTNPLNDLAVGASAHDLLSATTYTSINIQIEYSPNMQLAQTSINNLVAFLQTYLNKPGGITVTQTPVGSLNKSQVSLNDALLFEQANRTVYTSGNAIGIYILAADADYTTVGVGGIAYLNTSVILLEKTIQSTSGGIGQASRVKVESGVLEHEFGHLLGLVNNGTPMVVPHEDEAHKPHCNNSSCLMYYEIETSGLHTLSDNNVPQLDANCINDLKANGGK